MQNAECRMQNYDISGKKKQMIQHLSFSIQHFIKFRRNFMYLSIGNDMAVRDKSIKRTREFLDAAEKEGEVVPCDDLPKSFVLTSEYGFNRVHLTSLNSATLEKRLK